MTDRTEFGRKPEAESVNVSPWRPALGLKKACGVSSCGAGAEGCGVLAPAGGAVCV